MVKRRFESAHPLWIFTYMLAMLTVSMLTKHYIVLIALFLLSSIYVSLFLGIKKLKSSIAVGFFILLFMAGILPLFSHRGVTALFYINDMPVTLESVYYGIIVTFMLVVVFQWFEIFSETVDGEKIMYLFGRISPNLALLLAMIFRMIPQIRKKYSEVSDGQKGMGYKKSVKNTMKKVGITISWMLEESAETSVSMESRGYGVTKKRTSFSLYMLTPRTIFFCVINVIIFISLIVVIALGWYDVTFYPSIALTDFGIKQVIGIVILVIYGIYPILFGKEVLA